MRVRTASHCVQRAAHRLLLFPTTFPSVPIRIGCLIHSTSTAATKFTRKTSVARFQSHGAGGQYCRRIPSEWVGSLSSSFALQWRKGWQAALVVQNMSIGFGQHSPLGHGPGGAGTSCHTTVIHTAGRALALTPPSLPNLSPRRSHYLARPTAGSGCVANSTEFDRTAATRRRRPLTSPLLYTAHSCRRVPSPRIN